MGRRGGGRGRGGGDRFEDQVLRGAGREAAGCPCCAFAGFPWCDSPLKTPHIAFLYSIIMQYGESMVGQDRAEHFGFSGRGGGGGTKGGDAGSRNKPGQDVSFIRHVPKFLQVRENI